VPDAECATETRTLRPIRECGGQARRSTKPRATRPRPQNPGQQHQPGRTQISYQETTRGEHTRAHHVRHHQGCGAAQPEASLAFHCSLLHHRDSQAVDPLDFRLARLDQIRLGRRPTSRSRWRSRARTGPERTTVREDRKRRTGEPAARIVAVGESKSDATTLLAFAPQGQDQLCPGIALVVRRERELHAGHPRCTLAFAALLHAQDFPAT